MLAGAYVTERLRPGVAYIDHGARVDFIKAGENDRGGAHSLDDGWDEPRCVDVCPTGALSSFAQEIPGWNTLRSG